MLIMTSLKHADTVKQNFFDFIFTSDESTVDPILVHGNYDTLYKKIINCELICGCKVLVETKDGVPIGQRSIGISSVRIYTDKNGEIPTINNRPLLAIDNVLLVDCNSVMYRLDDPGIPFDDSNPEKK